MNAREVGRIAALIGLTPEGLADLFGVEHEWARTASQAGAAAVARIAWEMTRPGPEFPADLLGDDDCPFEGGLTVRLTDSEITDAHLALARFARAFRAYAQVPKAIVPPRPATYIVTKAEEYGDAESGPRVSQWLEVERRES